MRVATHGAVIGEEEDERLREVIARRWYTSGAACKEFERRLREFTGRRGVALCNSGSSANLLALSALTDEGLWKRPIRPGDEVITTALNFPTTLGPILQVGATPVFVDVHLPGMDGMVERIEGAITGKTKAVVLAHTLGYPFDARRVREICDQYGLWMVEDCCDALGSPGTMTGDLSTLSFYPAHHICWGEGGAVLYGDLRFERIVKSFRDWGRDCWCEPGQDNTCGIRFKGHYDHKYSFSRIGYHLTMTEFQAALGCAQMERLPGFIEARQLNHAYLWGQLWARGLGEYFLMPPATKASWFGFALICKPPVQRDLITQWLEAHDIQTRLVFGGNLLRQRAFRDIPRRVEGSLENTDRIHENGFWVGCWPGLDESHLDAIADSIFEYITFLGLPHD